MRLDEAERLAADSFALGVIHALDGRDRASWMVSENFRTSYEAGYRDGIRDPMFYLP